MDYAALFAAIPTPYLVLTPDLVIAEANEAYLTVVGRSRAELVGRPVFEAFPPTPDALDENGVPRVQVSFERARDTGRADTMPIQKYDIPDHETGGLVERFWSLISVPVLDESGRTVWILQRAEDITDYVRERDRGQAERERGETWRRRFEEAEADLYARASELRTAMEAKEMASRQLAALAEVALQLTNAVTLEDLTAVVFGSGLPALGADGGAVAVRDDERDLLLLDITATLGVHTQRDYAELPIEGPLPACVAARTGDTVLLPDQPAGLAFTEQMAGVYDATGDQAWAALPLEVGGRLLGSLTVGWKQPRALPERELELLHAFAAQCAQALDRIQVRQAERHAALESQRMSETLQRSLLTAPPEPDHLRIAVRYQPAAQAAQVGGDWYDAFLTPDGSTTLVVGDVAGHDRNAAAAMAQLRNVLRGVAQTLGEPPAAVLSALDRALAGLQVSALATAVLCQVEQGAADGARDVQVLRWSNAGHPPPLLIHADGTAELLTHEPDLLLGLQPDAPRNDHEVVLHSGSTVVLYTDGLVERRDEAIDDALERLRKASTDLHQLSAEQVCDALLERLAPDAEDDVALLVLRLQSEKESSSTDAPALGG